MGLLKKIKELFSKRNRFEVEVLDGIDIDTIHSDPEKRKEVQQKIHSDKKILEGLKPKYDQVVSNLTLIQKIVALPQEGLTELENVANTYSETLIEKNVYKEKMKNQNDAVMYLENYQDQIPKAIKEMKEVEEKQRIVKRDLDVLEGEKGDILYSIHRFKNAQKFVRFFLLFLIFAGALDALILTTLFFVYFQDIFMPSLISVTVFLFLGLWIVIFKRYIEHGLKRNHKLHQRVIELSNKIKIKYVQHQQVLEYQYEKYKVNSSEMFELRYENYQEIVKNKKSYNKVANSLSVILQDLESLLNNYNLGAVDPIMNYIEYFSSKKSRKLLLDDLTNRKEELQYQMHQYEKEIDFLTDLLQE